jgi:phosphoglucosamine mutase
MVMAAVASAEASLNGSGRVLVRKSGTEPLIRVMAEGDDSHLVETLVTQVCNALRETEEAA